MKTTTAKAGVIAGFILFAGLSITAISWQDSTVQKIKGNKSILDTVPKREIDIDIDMKDFDKAMKDLDFNMDKVTKELKEIDWKKISTEITSSLKDIDFKKIQLDIEKSLKDINWNKINEEVNQSLSKIDMEKMKLEINRAMKDVKENINMDELRKELEKVKEIDMDKMRKDLGKMKIEIDLNTDKIKTDLHKELGKAKEEIKAAKEQLADTKEVISLMEKDGLINQTDGYTIEMKEKSLFINDKKQSEEVSDKYRKYFKKDFKIRIKN